MLGAQRDAVGVKQMVPEFVSDDEPSSWRLDEVRLDSDASAVLATNEPPLSAAQSAVDHEEVMNRGDLLDRDLVNSSEPQRLDDFAGAQHSSMAQLVSGSQRSLPFERVLILQ
jgi:hypothetical protein